MKRLKWGRKSRDSHFYDFLTLTLENKNFFTTALYKTIALLAGLLKPSLLTFKISDPRHFPLGNIYFTQIEEYLTGTSWETKKLRYFLTELQVAKGFHNEGFIERVPIYFLFQSWCLMLFR